MVARIRLARLSSPLTSPRTRARLFRRSGATVGRARILHGGTYYGDLSKLTIADGVFINAGVGLFPTGGIAIGRNVSIGPHCLLMTGTHEIGGPDRRASPPTQFSSVSIGDGAWLGAGVTVQSGVTIGSGAVIAAGAVVTSDCEPNGFYAGVPAVLKRTLAG